MAVYMPPICTATSEFSARCSQSSVWRRLNDERW